MKKFALAVVIFFLVLSTAIIKNTTKQIEDEIFTAKENIRVLKSEFENILLEYDYLSSAERLLEYQFQYFEDELIQKKPITPSVEEVNENLPSRSAKFRYVIKKDDFYNFDTDIDQKFRNYIEIENYGDKL